MNENPETNVEPTTSTSETDDNRSAQVESPNEVQKEEINESIVIKDVDVDASAIVHKKDTTFQEIRIVAVESAVTDISIDKNENDEQETDDLSELVRNIIVFHINNNINFRCMTHCLVQYPDTLLPFTIFNIIIF